MSRTRSLPLDRLIAWGHEGFHNLITEVDLWKQLGVNFRRKQCLEELFKVVPGLKWDKLPTAGRPKAVLRFPPQENWLPALEMSSHAPSGLKFISPHFSTADHILVTSKLGSHAKSGGYYKRVISHANLLRILKIDEAHSALVVWVLDKALEQPTGGHSLLRRGGRTIWELPPAEVLRDHMEAYWFRLTGKRKPLGWPQSWPAIQNEDYFEKPELL